MKFQIPNNLTRRPEQILRKAGYFYIFDRISQQGSFVKKLRHQHYPRFHLYVTENDAEIIFDLHLDQSASRYKGQNAHNADYKSEEVRTELTRIYYLINEFIIK